MKNEVLIAGPMYPPTIESLDSTYTTHKLYNTPNREALLDQVAGRITAIASGHGGVTAAVINRLPQLKVIAHFGVGYDAVDVEAANARGIKVTNTPDVLTDEVADLAMALVLGTVRRTPMGDRFVRAGFWLKGSMPLSESLTDKTLGIIGMGRIGRAIASRAEAFKLKIAYQGPRRKEGLDWPYYADLVDLAKHCDILLAACPGGPATRGIVSRAVIEALGNTGYFVNISRGSVVDEPALLEALQQKKLAGAGLDVFADEPRVPQGFMVLDNVVLQPHVGSATHKTRRAMGQLMQDNLAAHFAGKALLTPVN
jgi:lactate dehydrogenase-like 2-hydroxyacid dehydrogenase